MRRTTSLAAIVACLAFAWGVFGYQVDFLGVNTDFNDPATIEKGRIGRESGKVANTASSVFVWEDKILSGYPDYMDNTEVYWRLNEGSILLDYMFFESRLYLLYFVSYPREEFWGFETKVEGTLYLVVSQSLVMKDLYREKLDMAITRLVHDGEVLDPDSPQSYFAYHPRKPDDTRQIVINSPSEKLSIFNIDGLEKTAEFDANLSLLDFDYLSYSPSTFPANAYAGHPVFKPNGANCLFGHVALVIENRGKGTRSIAAMSLNDGTFLWRSDIYYSNLVYCDGTIAVVAGSKDVVQEELVKIDLATGELSKYTAPYATTTTSYDHATGLVLSTQRRLPTSFEQTVIAWKLADQSIVWSHSHVCDTRAQCFVLPMAAASVDLKVDHVLVVSASMFYGFELETGERIFSQNIIHDKLSPTGPFVASPVAINPFNLHEIVGIVCSYTNEDLSESLTMFNVCRIWGYDIIERKMSFIETVNGGGKSTCVGAVQMTFISSGLFISAAVDTTYNSISSDSRIRVIFYKDVNPKDEYMSYFKTHGFGTYYTPMILAPDFNEGLGRSHMPFFAPIMGRSGELVELSVFSSRHTHHDSAAHGLAHWDLMDASLVPLPNGDIIQILQFGVVAIRDKETGARKYLKPLNGKYLSYVDSTHENGGVLIAFRNAIKLFVLRVSRSGKSDDWTVNILWEGDVTDYEVISHYQSVRIFEDEHDINRVDIFAASLSVSFRGLHLVRYINDDDGVKVLYAKKIEGGDLEISASLCRIALSQPIRGRSVYVAMALPRTYWQDSTAVVVFDEKLNQVWNRTVNEPREELLLSPYVSSISEYVVYSHFSGFIVYNLLDGKKLLKVGLDDEVLETESGVGVPYIIKQDYPIAIWLERRMGEWEYVSYNLATNMYVGNSSVLQGLPSFNRLELKNAFMSQDSAVMMKLEQIQLVHSFGRKEPGFMVLPIVGNAVVLGCSRSAGYFTDLFESEHPPHLEEHKRNNDGICVPCKAGTYSDQNICMRCPFGYIAPEDGMYLCEACPAGTYSDEIYATTCKTCPEGTTTIMEGQQWCDQCVDDPCGFGQCYIDRFTFEPKCNCYGLPYFDAYCFYPMYPAYLSPLALLLLLMCALCCYLHRRTTKYKSVFKARVPRLKLEEQQRRSNYDWEIDLSDAHTVAEMATGATATIYLVVLPSGVWAAAKVFHEVDGSSVEFRTETEILSKLRHPSIVEYFGACAHPPAIILEFAKMGSLRDYLKEKTLNVATIHRFALQIASGLSYLHEHDIIHRDLKSANVLLCSETMVKVTDFGISRSIAGEMTALAGTARWMAPEQICSNSYQRIEYNNKVDVYAFGLLIWEMFTRDIPYGDVKWDHEVMKKISAGILPIIPDTIPSLYKSLLERCWQTDPGLRPSFNEVIRELRSHTPGGLT